MSELNYYEILGIGHDADDAAIKNAFRKQAMVHHPDRPTGDENKFKAVKEAYDTLSDPQKRAVYDRFGKISEEYVLYEDPINERNNNFNERYVDIQEIFLKTTKPYAENLNNPKQLKEIFLQSAAIVNHFVSKREWQRPLIMGGSLFAVFNLKPEYHELSYRLPAYVAAAVAFYGSLRIAPLGAGIGGAAGSLIGGNIAKIGAIFSAAVNDDLKNVITNGGMLLGGIMGGAILGINTVIWSNDIAWDLIEHPLKVKAAVETISNPQKRDEFIANIIK